MPVDYYPNKSIADLKSILDALQARQTGGAITEVNAAGVRMVRDLGGSGNSRVEVEILRVRYSLYRRALGTEEAQNFANPYPERIRRTRARYTFS
jgi:hypothetical protein